MSNIVYVAASLDGYIADRNNQLDWLHSIPNPEHHDLGWNDFYGRVDAMVMGRRTFDVVRQYKGEWPYPRPVYVLSNSLKSLPAKYKKKVELICGSPSEVLKTLHNKGHENLYIDGGFTIQSFLKEDLIDEMIITIMPILLGGGVRLFGDLPDPLEFKHVKTEVLLDAMVQNHYRRKRKL